MKVTLSRKAHFNAAHRLYVKEWSDKKNVETFGKCCNPNYHGHNYELIVSVRGEVDPISGIVMDLKKLKTLISEEIEEYLDHKNLNIEIPEFKNINPSVENIAIVIWNILRPKISKNNELEVVLYETPRNYVMYNGK